MKYQGSKINPSKFEWGQLKYLLILCPLAIVYMLPILFIFATAFKPITELFAYPPRFWVDHPTWQNFTQLLHALQGSSVPLSRYLLNTLASTAVVMAASMMISLYAGYALAKRQFKGKKLMDTLNTMSMMFVPVAVSIPRYLVLSRLGIVNTFSALVIPLIAMPVGLFLLKQFIQDVPPALLEAARIDGAGENTIIWRIVFPIVKPALATVGILAFQNAWNAVEPSSLFVNNDMLRTFPFYISVLSANQGNAVSGAGMSAASALLQFLPNLIVFIILQSNVMNTMSHSGIK